jgi:hypothetical protein
MVLRCWQSLLISFSPHIVTPVADCSSYIRFPSSEWEEGKMARSVDMTDISIPMVSFPRSVKQSDLPFQII